LLNEFFQLGYIQVGHVNGLRCDNRVENLMDSLGPLHSLGKLERAKLTGVPVEGPERVLWWKEIDEIRMLLEQGYNTGAIGKSLNLNQNIVEQIRAGVYVKRIEEEFYQFEPDLGVKEGLLRGAFSGRFVGEEGDVRRGVELLQGVRPREIAKLLKVDYFTVYQILMGREEILEMPGDFPGFRSGDNVENYFDKLLKELDEMWRLLG
jgi:hypothetical protein